MALYGHSVQNTPENMKCVCEAREMGRKRRKGREKTYCYTLEKSWEQQLYSKYSTKNTKFNKLIYKVLKSVEIKFQYKIKALSA